MTINDLFAFMHGASIVAVLMVGFGRYDAYSRRCRWIVFAAFIATMIGTAATA